MIGDFIFIVYRVSFIPLPFTVDGILLYTVTLCATMQISPLWDNKGILFSYLTLLGKKTNCFAQAKKWLQNGVMCCHTKPSKANEEVPVKALNSFEQRIRGIRKSFFCNPKILQRYKLASTRRIIFGFPIAVHLRE